MSMRRQLEQRERERYARMGAALTALDDKYGTIALHYHDAHCEWSLGLDYGRCVAEDCAKTLWTDADRWRGYRA